MNPVKRPNPTIFKRGSTKINVSLKKAESVAVEGAVCRWELGNITELFLRSAKSGVNWWNFLPTPWSGSDKWHGPHVVNNRESAGIQNQTLMINSGGRHWLKQYSSTTEERLCGSLPPYILHDDGSSSSRPTFQGHLLFCFLWNETSPRNFHFTISSVCGLKGEDLNEYEWCGIIYCCTYFHLNCFNENCLRCWKFERMTTKGFHSYLENAVIVVSRSSHLAEKKVSCQVIKDDSPSQVAIQSPRSPSTSPRVDVSSKIYVLELTSSWAANKRGRFSSRKWFQFAQSCLRDFLLKFLPKGYLISQCRVIYLFHRERGQKDCFILKFFRCVDKIT